MPVLTPIRRLRSLGHLAGREDDTFRLDELAAVLRQTLDRIPLPSKLPVDMEFTPEVLHAVEALRTQEYFVFGALAVDLEQLAGIDEERPEDVVERERGTAESGMFLSIRMPEVRRGPSGVSLQMHHHVQLAPVARHREIVQADVPGLVEFQILSEHSIDDRDRLEGKDLQEGVSLREVAGEDSDVSSNIDHGVAGLELNRAEQVLVTLQLRDDHLRRRGVRVVADLQLGLVDPVLPDGRNEPIDEDERDASPVALEHDLIQHHSESAGISGSVEELAHLDRDDHGWLP